MRLHFFNSAVIANSKTDYSVISYGDFADTNTLLIRKFFMDDQRSIILLESPLWLKSYPFNTKNMTVAISTKRHTRPKVKPTIKSTFDSDLAEKQDKKNMYVSGGWGGTPGILVILGGGLSAGSPNPDPISDQKCNSSHPFLDLASIHTHSQTWSLRNNVIST